jgi:uncharacterized protein (TIGR02646 family)
MRRLNRTVLPSAAQDYLCRRQASADLLHDKGELDIEREWKAARQTQSVGTVLAVLQQMTGPRERCMYCVDSHGSDIEHYRPKARFPRRAFQWHNLLLCCTECGRLKGDSFPMANRRPLLIDPTAEDPWQHIDFDPDTGNLSARFDLATDTWSSKGAATVNVLHLDRREAMATGYMRTYRRLAAAVRSALPQLADGSTTAQALSGALDRADDHGLLAWCLHGTGQTLAPFCDLRNQHPQVWASCLEAVR